MKYREQQCPTTFLSDRNLSFLIRETLYWVCQDEKKAEEFFDEDELYPVSESIAYKKVVDYLKEAIEQQKKIVISGDFDCDGICATTLMFMGLKMAGVNAGYYIPNRNTDGYGLSPKLVQWYADKGYEVIICVDNGVIAHEAIALAKEKGMSVVILDHHEMDDKTMDYEYVLHPLLMEEPYHFLCGSGVVFEVLRSLAGVTSYMTTLACLAAISDMMVLCGENRRVVRLGLKAMEESHSTPLWYLMEGEDLDECALALKLTPKINAVGRMFSKANPNQLVRFLLSDNAEQLSLVAKQIKDLNEERKELSKEILAKAEKQVIPDHSYIMAVGEYHEGIVGLVASNLVHTYHKPTFVLSKEEGVLKGSARSVFSIDLVDMLRTCPYLDVFGGHKAAGGLSLKECNLESFKTYVEEYMNSHPLQEESQFYINLPLSEFTLENIEKLSKYRPYLRVQEEPLYRFNHLLLDQIIYMGDGKHGKWNVGKELEIVYFQIPDIVRERKQIDVIGTLKVSKFRGKKKAIFTVKDYIFEE